MAVNPEPAILAVGFLSISSSENGEEREMLQGTSSGIRIINSGLMQMAAANTLFRTIQFRCSCGFKSNSRRSSCIHLSLVERGANIRGEEHAPHAFVEEYVDVPIPVLRMSPEPDGNNLDGEQLPAVNDHGFDDMHILHHAPPHQPQPEGGVDGHDGPPPLNLLGAPIPAAVPLVPPAVVPAQQNIAQPGLSDYGPFLNWSSLQVARFYADWDLSRAKLLQLVALLNDKRFKGETVNASFISQTSVNTVEKIMEREKVRYGLEAPVPFRREEFIVDGVGYEFFFRDLVSVALQLFATSTTQEADGFQYKATPLHGANGRIFTSCSTGL